jgi:hypothetical protein
MTHARRASTCWHMGVELFLEVAALDISTPFVQALNGDAAVFTTTTVIDFSPKVGRHISHHWCTCHGRYVG